MVILGINEYDINLIYDWFSNMYCQSSDPNRVNYRLPIEPQCLEISVELAHVGTVSDSPYPSPVVPIRSLVPVHAFFLGYIM